MSEATQQSKIKKIIIFKFSELEKYKKKKHSKKTYVEKDKFIISKKNLFFDSFCVILKNSCKDKTPRTINTYDKKKIDFIIMPTKINNMIVVIILFFKFRDIINHQSFFLYFYIF